MNRWTQLIQFDPNPGDPYDSNNTPIYQTATFAQSSAIKSGSYDYTRSGNPTRTVLETQLAKLEKANHAFAYASGMAAINSVIRLLKQGDHIISGQDIYGGTFRLLSQLLPKQGILVDWVDTTDLDQVARSFTAKTRLLLVESPTNPLQQISDLKALAQLAHGQNAWLAVDNSLMSPWLQQPLTLDADLVIHSATKHLAGHSDLVAGVVAANCPEIAKELAFFQNAEGTGLAPFDCWLLLRSIKTLGLRVERQQANAQRVAQYLTQAKLKQIYYPGLSSHAGYELHKRQALGPGNLISFETGSLAISKQIVEATKLFRISVSFGSLQSLISLPCHMSHASIPNVARRLPLDLIRLSVGIEGTEDLISDLKQAISGVK